MMEQTEGSINILWYQNFFMINCNMLMAVTKFYFVNSHFIPVLLFSTLYPSSRAPAKWPVVNDVHARCQCMLRYAKGGGAIVSLSAPMRVVGESILAKFLELQSCWITMHIQVSVLGMEDIGQVLHGFEGVNAQGCMDFHALCSMLIKVATPHDTTKKIDGQALQMTSGIRLAGWYIAASTNLLVTNLSFNQAICMKCKNIALEMSDTNMVETMQVIIWIQVTELVVSFVSAGHMIILTEFNAEHPEA
ncbi:hypothetical protein EDB19DRAFT_1828501 [Suillus lakei]|nr:hypothetical protein EDB19DRAFT_1828501 [Suillus lakei]